MRAVRAARRAARARRASAIETMEQWDAERRKGSFGAPLPGAPNVGSRVLAKPLRFELWGAHEVLSLVPIYAVARYDLADKLDKLTAQKDTRFILVWATVVV